ncbi:hypothetical protein AKO1_001783 [Acrasis kona]|uniref:Cilia-and flagella-associated protein 96 n=1 Tax=Acrasis kona TaxID=1008807 RepID=A0AAW2ZAY5_9EUKA
MTDMQVLGIFSQPSYIGIGDKFHKDKGKQIQFFYSITSKDVKGRHTGKQLLTNPSKKGRVGTNTTFGAFNPLYEKESYQDPGFQEKQFSKTEKVKIKAGPFKPSSPSKRSAGLGNYYGTIGNSYPHMTDFNVVKKGDKPKPIEQPKKNIMTSPSKKGTYGYLKTTIGGEYEYKSDPYNASNEKALQEKKLHKSRIVGQPFKSTSHGLDFFDTHKNVAASAVYGTDSKVLPPRAERSEERKRVEKPFKPSSPSKRGLNSTFTPFPEYKSDEYDKASDPSKKQTNERVFKPVSYEKTTPCRSVVFHNLHTTL